MPSTFAVTVTGLRAAQSALDAAGHNIANLATPGFRRQQVVASSTPEGGVTTSLRQAVSAGAALEADLVGVLQAKGAFVANLQVFKAADRMLGTLLDATG